MGLGCQKPAAEPLPKFSKQMDPAEEDFERVTERLKSAIGIAQPAADSGVVSTRDFHVRLIPPAADDELYTAEVTIETTTKLAKSKIPPRARRPRPVDPVGTTEADVNPAPPVDKGDELVAASETHRSETFQLVYENQRWKLATEPKERIDRIFFEYALSN